MVPYDILAGTIEYKTSIGNERNASCWNSMDIRILELAPDYFTLRLVKESEKRIFGSITLHFYQYENVGYESLNITDYEMMVRDEEDGDSLGISTSRFWTEYKISLENSKQLNEFRILSNQLTKEYLTYMENKLTLSDGELAAAMTSYPVDQDDIYAGSVKEQLDEWKMEMQDEVEETFSLGKKASECKGFSLLLDNPEKYKDFLEKNLVNNYIKSATNGGFKPFLGVHVGNSFCPHLLPDEKILTEIIDKAKRKNLHITFLIPPVSQSMYEWMITYLKRLHEVVENEDEMILDIEVNDLGMKRLLEQGDWKHFRVREGLLLHKQTKDSRLKYRNKIDGINLDQSDDAVYYPLYQTNTGTFCTLCAKKYSGERGLQKRITECEMPCLKEGFLYPKHFKMIGMYNSIFGMNSNLKYDSRRWVVINL